MGIDPVSLSLIIGGTMAAAGAATSAMQARAQNKAIAQSMAQSQKAATIQTAQVNEQTDLELLRRRNESNQIDGRLRVAAAEHGVGFGGTYEALGRQEAYNEALNEQVVQRGTSYNNQRIASEMDAQMLALHSRTQNSILSAFTGATQGGQAGLQIGHALGTAFDDGGGAGGGGVPRTGNQQPIWID